MTNAGRAWEPLGRALAAYVAGEHAAEVRIHTDLGGVEVLPAAVFFRSPGAMPEVETAALEEARGRVLDIGAGAGAHALALQERGLAVTALEVLPQACRIMRRRGVADVRSADEGPPPGVRFDTALLLMNGVGLAGTLGALPAFLTGVGASLAPGGQILLDSTDPRAWDGPEDGRYVGEVHYRLEFGGVRGEVYPFLYVDPRTLAAAARAVGFDVEVLVTQEDGRYLARLERDARLR